MIIGNSPGRFFSDVVEKNELTVDVYFHEDGNNFNLATDTTFNSNIINVQPGHGLIVGDNIGIKQNGRWYEGQVINVNVNEITLDSPMDYPFTTDTERCHIHKIDMNVDGSVTPKEFHVIPPLGVKYNITNVVFFIGDDAAMDHTKFGGIAALPKGLILRKEDGITQNVYNVKSNGDLSLRNFHIRYDDRAPGSNYGFQSLSNFGGRENRNVIFRLNGDQAEELKIIVQDDLTSLTKFQAIAQGHVFPY